MNVSPWLYLAIRCSHIIKETFFLMISNSNWCPMIISKPKHFRWPFGCFTLVLIWPLSVSDNVYLYDGCLTFGIFGLKMFWQVLFDPVCDLIQLLGDLYLWYHLSRLEPLAQDYSPWEGRKKVYQEKVYKQFYVWYVLAKVFSFNQNQNITRKIHCQNFVCCCEKHYGGK